MSHIHAMNCNVQSHLRKQRDSNLILALKSMTMMSSTWTRPLPMSKFQIEFVAYWKVEFQSQLAGMSPTRFLVQAIGRGSCAESDALSQL